MQTNNYKMCAKCHKDFTYKSEETWFDDKGFGYSTKLVKCPHCECVNVIKHVEDRTLNVNNYRKFYDYDQRY